VKWWKEKPLKVKLLAIGGGLLLTALVYYRFFATYEKVWSIVTNPKTAEEIRVEGYSYMVPGKPYQGWPAQQFTATRRRWDDSLVYLKVLLFDENEHLTGWAAGPLTKNGKLHGEQTTVIVSPYLVTHTWHWYGEEISEGEWHLRNK
jgi:hypothetical protein